MSILLDNPREVWIQRKERERAARGSLCLIYVAVAALLGVLRWPWAGEGATPLSLGESLFFTALSFSYTVTAFASLWREFRLGRTPDLGVALSETDAQRLTIWADALYARSVLKAKIAERGGATYENVEAIMEATRRDPAIVARASRSRTEAACR